MSERETVHNGAVPGQIFATRPRERRGEERRTVLKAGEIVFKRDFCLMNCVVLDLSSKGARVRPESPEDCPEIFLLRLNDLSCHVCSVIWREADQVGVTFVAELD